MAKELPAFKASVDGPPRTPKPEWFNGSLWQLQKGVDFPQTRRTHDYRTNLSYYARKHNVKIVSRVSHDEQTIFLQAYTQTKPDLPSAELLQITNHEIKLCRHAACNKPLNALSVNDGQCMFYDKDTRSLQPVHTEEEEEEEST